MTGLTQREQLARLAAMSGRKLERTLPPSPLTMAALQVQLTTTARQSGATWAHIAIAMGHGDAVKAKRDAKRLETTVTRQLRAQVTVASLAQPAGMPERKGYDSREAS